jgi:DNA-binding HxlR family transcriptional regulator
MAKRLPTYFHCPTEFTLAVLDGKWKTVILSYLKERPFRYAELRKLVPRLSDKVLTERLRDLARSGLIVRQEAAGGRTNTYTLTGKGRSLIALLQHLYSWGVENSSSFGVTVGAPLADLDSAPEARGAARGRSRTRPRDSARLRTL